MNDEQLEAALEQHIYASWLGKTVEADDSRPMTAQYNEKLQRIREKNNEKRTPSKRGRVTVRKFRTRRTFR